MKGEAVPEGLVAKMIDDKINSPEVAHHGYVLEGFPCESDSGYDIGKQMEMLKNWKLQPDFIVNLRVSFFLKAKKYKCSQSQRTIFFLILSSLIREENKS